MERFNLILMVAFGGSIGAVSRYLLSSLIQDRILTSFPIGTLIIKVLGCFSIGFFLKTQAASSGRYVVSVKVCPEEFLVPKGVNIQDIHAL